MFSEFDIISFANLQFQIVIIIWNLDFFQSIKGNIEKAELLTILDS